MGWILQKEDTNLPSWLKDNLSSKCDCGAEVENFYNDAGRITKSRCSDPCCKYMVAQRVVGMCKLLNVKGIGPETALSIVNSHSIRNHYLALPYIFTKGKPEVDLYTFLRMSFTPGMDESWASVSGKYTNLDELYSKYNGKYKDVLLENEQKLREGVKYVQLKEPIKMKYEPLIRGTVMISGTLKNFPDNRNKFIAALNYASQGLIELGVSEHKKKNGIMALIQEADTPRRGKAECAIDAGIPIMTPDEFQAMIMQRLSVLSKERGLTLRKD